MWHGKFPGDGCPKMPKGWKPPKEGKIVKPALIGPSPDPTPAPEKASPPAPAKPPAPGRKGTFTFPDSRAEIIKGGGANAIELLPERVDFIVDKEHTLGLWNFGFHRLHDATVVVDWFLGWDKHMPLDQFQVSKTGLMAIEMEPRNFYARSATWFCKRAGCQTLEQAHSLIDSVLFFEAFVGIGGAIIWHYRTVLKETTKPGIVKWREKRAEKKAITAAQKAAAIPAASTVVSEVAA